MMSRTRSVAGGISPVRCKMCSALLIGRQRIAQFMGQRGQEFVFAAIGFAKLRVQLGIFDEINRLPGAQVDQVDFAVRGMMWLAEVAWTAHRPFFRSA